MPTKEVYIDDEDREKLGETWQERIRESRKFEDVYFNQAIAAYRLYNKTYDGFLSGYNEFGVDNPKKTIKIQDFLAKKVRSNVFYANIETLMSLVLSNVPNIKINFKNQCLTGTSAIIETQQARDVAVAILEEVARYYIRQSLTKNPFKKFKLDHFITGRGVLWNDYTRTNYGLDTIDSIDLDHVSFLNFAIDPKLDWSQVRWVARRVFLSKQKIKEVYPNIDLDEMEFQNDPYTASGEEKIVSGLQDVFMYSYAGKYASIWEIWDKQLKQIILISPQYKQKLMSIRDVEGVPDKYFFPTPEPPVSIMNGMNMLPSSEIWLYVNELLLLSYISEKKEQLVKSIQFKGYADSRYMAGINAINKADNNEIALVDSIDPQNPDFIHYLDNKPKVDILNYLSQEYGLTLNTIYEITGISEQMRNISAVGENPQIDETATEVKTKAEFGSRRLREKQDIVVSYLREIYENVAFRICSLISVDTIKKITSVRVADNQKELDDLDANIQQYQQTLAQTQQQLNQIAASMSGQQSQGATLPESALQQQQDPQAQQQPQPIQMSPQEQQSIQEKMQQVQQQMQQTQHLLDKLIQKKQSFNPNLTWEKINIFFKTAAMKSIDIDVELDDINSFLEKNQLSQQLMSDNMGLMNTMMNVMQLSVQNPDFVETFTDILNATTNNNLYDVTQKRATQNFVATLRKLIEERRKNPPPPPPPTPDEIKANAAQIQAQAKAKEADAKVAFDTAEIRNRAIEADSTRVTAQSRLIEAQGKLIQVQGEIQQLQASGNIHTKALLDLRKQEAAHQHEVEKLQMQIASQDNRAKDKFMTDEHLAKLKIAADKNRAAERIQTELTKQQMKQDEIRLKANLDADLEIAKEMATEIKEELKDGSQNI